MIIEHTAELAERQSRTYTRLCNLPRLNPAATRLLTVNNDDHELEEFEVIFGSDPALAAELLFLANSAEFGLRASVPNIRFALMLLGTERIRKLAVTLAMSRFVRSAGPAGATLWEHGVATAVIADEVGRALRTSGAHLYTSGLTHDLGRLGLLLSGGGQYGEVLSMEFHSMTEATEFERIRFGVTHAEAGAFLARSWQFPATLSRCIERHHDELSSEDGDAIRIAQAACALAAIAGYPELPSSPGAACGHSFGPELENRPELAPERLRTLVEERIHISAGRPK